MRKEWEHNFAMGRIHISSSDRYNFSEKMYKLITECSTYTDISKEDKEKATWAFGDVGKEKFVDEEVLYGRLGKIKGDRVGTFYDTKNRAFRDQHMTQPLAQSYSHFIIYPKKQLIVFEEKKPNIKLKVFIAMFEKMYVSHFKDLTTLRIQLVVEEDKALKYLRDKKIIKIKFANLVPSNPEEMESFKKLDEMLKIAGIDKSSMQFENKKQGIKLEKEGIVREGIALSDAGYGTYRATIEISGENKTISSKDNIVRETIPIPDKTMSQVVNQMWNRFKKYMV
jgi:hypothetical protein